MGFIWVLKLKLNDKFREEIEEYFLSLNASISSIDAENNLNTLSPKLFNTNVFFINKPNIDLIKKYLINFKIKPNNILLLKKTTGDFLLQSNKMLEALSIGRFIFTEKKNKF
jgi:hypothetical protein